MKISKIKIANYRLLKKLELDLEDELSLVIGKNNCGKTSLLSILDKFLGDKTGSRSFSCDDFNIEFQKLLKEQVENDLPYDDKKRGISLKLFLQYSGKDNLANISKVMMDLDPSNTTIVLAFEYALNEDTYNKLKGGFKKFREEQIRRLDIYFLKLNPNPSAKEIVEIDELKNQKKKVIFYEFFKKHHEDYFRTYKKSLGYDVANSVENDEDFADLSKDNVQIEKIINFKLISARRDVSNKETDKTLSVLSSKYYEKREGLEADSVAIQQFKDTLSDTDSHLDVAYTELFKNVIDKVKTFGGVKPGDSIIKVVSTLQHRELLKGNTTVMYAHNDDHSLPEHHNGLGYMNLISMIFEIEVLLTDFRKESREDENPADINLLFIEEPEAHTHPQMQYVFIKNIKNILKSASKGGNGQAFDLQTIITTHSSHIASEGQFEDIKYFAKTGSNEVSAKNLKDLEKEYAGNPEYYKFLKQYLTLSRAELFFADKAIFIEGDTERILLPAMMKKADQIEMENPLMSQNISIVEVGAYSHIFERFICFIGVKSLIISDIDSVKDVPAVTKAGKPTTIVNKCRVADVDVTVTTNASLMFFHTPNKNISHFTSLKLDQKILTKTVAGKWSNDSNGTVLFIYQISEKDKSGVEYCARSFEDAFFHLNRQFIIDNKNKFYSLKNKGYFEDTSKDCYELAEHCVDKKPSFAMEVLLNSKSDAAGNEFVNWEVPAYINEGLLWLKKN